MHCCRVSPPWSQARASRRKFDLDRQDLTTPMLTHAKAWAGREFWLSGAETPGRLFLESRHQILSLPAYIPHYLSKETGPTCSHEQDFWNAGYCTLHLRHPPPKRTYGLPSESHHLSVVGPLVKPHLGWYRGDGRFNKHGLLGALTTTEVKPLRVRSTGYTLLCVPVLIFMFATPGLRRPHVWVIATFPSA